MLLQPTAACSRAGAQSMLCLTYIYTYIGGILERGTDENMNYDESCSLLGQGVVCVDICGKYQSCN